MEIDVFVPVVDKNQKPLMPTSWPGAKRWIKSGKATPFYKKGVFCVRLNVEPSGRRTQDTAIGIDPGSKREGFTVKSEAHTYINILADAVTWVKGKHTLKFGGEYRNIGQNFHTNGNESGSFSFGRGATAIRELTSGSPIASFLLEQVSSGSSTFRDVSAWYARADAFIGHFGDTWKVTPKLTLSLGVRWDMFRPTVEKYNRLSFFDAGTPNPEADGRPGAPRGFLAALRSRATPGALFDETTAAWLGRVTATPLELLTRHGPPPPPCARPLSAVTRLAPRPHPLPAPPPPASRPLPGFSSPLPRPLPLLLPLLLPLFSFFFFFFNDTATTEIYTLSLHDALPILCLDF